MSDDDVQRIIGRLLATIEDLKKRTARLENAIIAVLAGAAALWAKSQGFW